MRTSVTVRLDRPLTEVAELARRAEDLGFDGVWLADHYYHREVMGALALVATATSRVRFGTAVVSPLLRHPALLASAAASLAEISGDRFVLGVGPGGYEFASELGVPARRPLGLTRETVEIVRGLCEGRTTVAGETFRTDNAQLRWTPRAVPVHLAARGPKMLQLAGRIADGVITHGIGERHVAWAREQLTSGGGKPELVMMLDVQLDADRPSALDAMRPRCLMMAGGSYADELVDVYGLDADDVSRLRATVRGGDREAAARLVTDDMVDAFGLAGPPEHVVQGLDALAAQDVDEAILSVGGGDLDEATGQLQDLAKAVLR